MARKPAQKLALDVPSNLDLSMAQRKKAKRFCALKLFQKIADESSAARTATETQLARIRACETPLEIQSQNGCISDGDWCDLYDHRILTMTRASAHHSPILPPTSLTKASLNFQCRGYRNAPLRRATAHPTRSAARLRCAATEAAVVVGASRQSSTPNSCQPNPRHVRYGDFARERPRSTFCAMPHLPLQTASNAVPRGLWVHLPGSPCGRHVDGLRNSAAGLDPVGPRSGLGWPDGLVARSRDLGANDSAVRQLRAVGTERYLDRQLYQRGDALPVPVQSAIAGLSISQQPLEQLVLRLEEQRKAAEAITNDEDKKAAQQAYQQALTKVSSEAAARSLLRDLYSPNQLQEQMTWFWLNHFNVFLYKSNLRAMVGDFEDRAIRPHALGRFRDLLMATMRHPAMLRYLDNEAEREPDTSTRTTPAN